MAVIWLLLIASGVFVQGHRIPRQYFYDAQSSQGGNIQRGRVPISQNSPASVAICKLVSSAGHQVTGNIVLRQTNAEDPVEITGTVSGLTPGYHGFHVHQNANLGDNCKAAGSHFNPEKQTHGAPQDPIRHAGDLGNIPVDSSGISNFQILDSQISLFENSPRRVVGRAIVIHQNEDDLGRGNDEESKKTGNAGPRVACCVIEPVHHSYISPRPGRVAMLTGCDMCYKEYEPFEFF